MHLRRVDENPEDVPSELLPYEKVVVFVRHGQSIANTLAEGMKMDLSQEVRDSRLTAKGESQAAALQGKWVASCKPQIILSSPLTRALQTACLAFENLPLPIVAWPCCTEFYPEYPECQGRQREQLEGEPKLTGLRKWKDVHLGNVVGDWWSIAGDLERLDVFLAWLRWCPETRIVVVCHWGFIMYLMEHVGYAERALLKLDNCTQLRTVWHPEAPPSHIPPVPGQPDHGRSYAVWLEPDRSAPPPLLAEYDRFCAAARADAALRDCTFIARRGGRLHVALSSFLPLPFELVQRLGLALRTEALRLAGRGAGVPPSESMLAWGVGGADALSCVVNEERSLYAALQFDSPSLQKLCVALKEMPGLQQHAAAFRTSGTYAVTLADSPQGRAVHLGDFKHILVPSKFPLLCAALGLNNGADGGGGSSSNGREWREQLASMRWYLCLMEKQEGDTGVTVRREPGMVVPLFHTP